MANFNVDVEVVDEERRNSKEFKAINMTGKFPCLDMGSEGTINESAAIAKFFAHDHATLLGASNIERAQVDQWLFWAIGNVSVMYPAVRAIFGWAEVEQAHYNDSVKQVKDNLKAVNQALTGDWLVGNGPTVADIFVGLAFLAPMQTFLDGGVRKAFAKAGAWMERVMALPEFRAVFGNCKLAAKMLKPATIKKEEKKVAPKKVEAPKPKAAEGEKPKNPLECLPETSFDLFNFKTLFVNHKDKRNGGMAEFKKQVDLDGWSFWHLHYEKFGDEGKVLYKFENLNKGFLQRAEGFRKYSFGRNCILGAEPCLEIEAVWCWRGQVVPQELKDHPQFEYFKQRKLDANNADDWALITDFFAGEEGGQCHGQFIESIHWHK